MHEDVELELRMEAVVSKDYSTVRVVGVQAASFTRESESLYGHNQHFTPEPKCPLEFCGLRSHPEVSPCFLTLVSSVKDTL